MLEPSSSEEESENETLEDENRDSDVLSLPSVEQRSLSASGDNLSVTGSSQTHISRSASSARPSSPSPSLASEHSHSRYERPDRGERGERIDHQSSRDREKEELEKAEREKEERIRRLQIYVFVMRCIAYPFNAKQPTDMPRRQTKVTKQQLQTIKERFQSFLNGELNIAADEAFMNAVQSYFEVFLKSDRVASMVKSGCCSANDFREVFKNNIEKRVRSLPEIDGLSKETVLSSWMAKFDQIFRGDEDPRKSSQRLSTATSENMLTKDQLYEMFQNILHVHKYEHTILFNALQVNSK